MSSQTSSTCTCPPELRESAATWASKLALAYHYSTAVQGGVDWVNCVCFHGAQVGLIVMSLLWARGMFGIGQVLFSICTWEGDEILEN